MTFCAGSRQVTRKNMYRTDCGTAPSSAAKPVIESKHQLRPGPVDLHLLVGSWRVGGIPYVNVWLESYYDPPEGHPGQHAYTYRRLSSQFQFSLSAVTLVYLSQWWILYLLTWAHSAKLKCRLRFLPRWGGRGQRMSGSPHWSECSWSQLKGIAPQNLL